MSGVLSTTAVVTGDAGGLAARLAERLGAGVTADALASADTVVHVAGVASPLIDRALADVDDAEWDLAAEAPIREAMAVLQRAYSTMAGRGGSIVVVVPSIALTGGPGLAPFAAAAEGIRLLMKSAARQWGQRGIRVNAVALPVAAWAVEQPDEHVLPSKFGPSLPEADLLRDASDAIALLADERARGITGATIIVDAGTLMVP